MSLFSPTEDRKNGERLDWGHVTGEDAKPLTLGRIPLARNQIECSYSFRKLKFVSISQSPPMTYLPPASLPSTLWQNGRYHVARHLQAAYEKQLAIRNLLDLAKNPPTKKDIYGDETLAGTNEHFALRFSASVMRTQSVLLDTQAKFGPISRDVILTFSSHRISILDIPCGTGAGGLALLSVIHELRLAGIIPTLPLEISILAGDKSVFALGIYVEQLNQLRESLRTTGINVDIKIIELDATDLISTTRLCGIWEQTVFQADESFVLVTNFSGAGKKLFEQFKESFRHISARASHKNATLLWIEPGDPGGKTFLARISEIIAPLFKNRSAGGHEPPSSENKGWHDLQECELSIRSSVHHYARST
jgi:hypothetical protein